MKKRLIPATIAALAISLTSVVAPTAYAEDAPNAEASQTFEADVTLEKGTSETVSFGNLLRSLESPYGTGQSGQAFDALDKVTFGEGWLSADYTGNNRLISADQNAPAGEHTVSVTITFTGETFETVTGTLNVKVPDETDPVISAIEEKTWEVNTAIEPITVAVADETAVGIEVTGLPDGVTFDEATNTISGTPTSTVGASFVTIKATDIDGNDAEITFDYSVAVDTTAPVITDIDDQKWVVDTAITPIAVVVDDETADVEVTGLPEGVDFDEETLTISGTPTELIESPVTVTINAEDAAGNDATAVTFTASVVEADEDAPVISAINDQEWKVGEAVDLTVEVDDDTATVEVTGLPAGVSYDQESGKITGTPTAVTEEDGTATVTATDAAGNDSTETFNYTVDEASDDGSSVGSDNGSSLGDNPVVIAVVAVVAAIAAFIGGVATGIIQLPPAIANLLPF